MVFALTHFATFAIINAYKNMNKSIKTSDRITSRIRDLAIFCFIFGMFFLIIPNIVSANTNTTTFLVNKSYDRSGRSQVEAFLEYTSQNAYFYIEKEFYDSLTTEQKDTVHSQMTETGNNFDKTVYPKIRNIFGEEWTPGIDGDKRITILFTRLDYDIGGYFNPNDEYDKDLVVNEASNEREMLYINPIYIDDPRLDSFIAHEFQHMITWNQKTKKEGEVDAVWINEGRSELASSIVEEFLGTKFTESNLYARKSSFLLNYWDSLTDWDGRNYDYGTVSIFAQYLKDKFGLDFFKKITANEKTGIESVNYELETTYATDFKDVFTNWTIANYLNDTGTNTNYGYNNANLSGTIVKPEKTEIEKNEEGVFIEASIEDWSSRYYEIKIERRTEGDFYLDLSFNGMNSGIFGVPYIIKYKNETEQIKKMQLDSKQDSAVRIKSSDNNIEKIIVIPSSQKTFKDSNNVDEYSFKISLDIISGSDQTNKISDGSLIKTLGDEKVYVIENGQKRWIANPETFSSRGYKWEEIVTISVEEIENFKEGEKLDTANIKNLDGKLIKSQAPEIYIVQNGKKRWVPNIETFNYYAFNWADVIEMTEKEIANYPKTENLSICPFKNGALIQGDGPRVYLIEQGRIRWITSAEIFVKNNYKWSNIIKTTDNSISQLLQGQDIK